MLKQAILLSLMLSSGLLANGWDYEEKGPNVWGSLNEDWKTCAIGKEQSPINIIPQDSIEVKNTLLRSYENHSKTILNNGHTVQVDYGKSGGVSIENKGYELKQFHFHTPSETQINSKQFPLEIHFVHQNSQGQLLVLSVLVKEGKKNESLEKILNVMPQEEGKTKEFLDFYPQNLMPKENGYFEFMGSLTTPPCSEGVTWVVLKENIEASKEQIEKIHKVLGNNTRSTQPINQRKIKSAN